MAQIHIRRMVAADKPFITDSFLGTFRKSDFGDGVPARVLLGLFEPLLAIWDVFVAVSPDDSDEILGWICSRSPDRVAWIYIKAIYRRAGVATSLLAHAGVGRVLRAPFVATSRWFVEAAREKGFRIRYRPHDRDAALDEVNALIADASRQ